MTTNFLQIFNESNSLIDEDTNEIVITNSKIKIDGICQIKSSCKITSAQNTVISGDLLEILTPSVSLTNITFEMAIHAKRANNFTMKNCSINSAKEHEGSLLISNCENVILSHINITSSVKIPGLYVHMESIVNADHLFIHNLTESLLVCNSSSYITVTNSTFQHTEANGIFTSGKSYVEVRDSTFLNTKYPAIYVTESQLQLSSTKFEGTEQNALGIYKSPDFSIEKCTFNNVSGTAIQICDGSIGVVNENRIFEIDGNGIFCSESKIECKKNNITDLQYPAIAITSNSTASLFENIISRIKYSGVCIRGAKDVLIKGNKISYAKESGISISDSENCVVENNEIKHCDITSIESYNQSKVIVRNNLIESMGKYCFLVYTSGFLKAENNDIRDIGQAMAKLAYKGSGEFENNKVINCSEQCECKTTSKYIFSNNGNFVGVTNDIDCVSKSIKLEASYVDHNNQCLKCHAKGRDYYLIECGHKVYCKECAEEALKNKEKCPLCRFPIVNVSSGFGASNDDMCIICFDKKADCIILPCGHVGVCSTCLESWFKNKQCCPICRTEPSFYKKIINDM